MLLLAETEGLLALFGTRAPGGELLFTLQRKHTWASIGLYGPEAHRCPLKIEPLSNVTTTFRLAEDEKVTL